MQNFLGKNRPLVIAHRGASKHAPEHTLSAYQLAAVDQADGFECDLRLSKDLVPVCFHDGAMTRTSNGFGRLGNKTITELEELDFGSWFGPNPKSDENWTRLLTAEKLFEFVSNLKSSIMLVETKHFSESGSKLEAKAIEALNKYHLINSDPNTPRAALMSFSIPALIRARRLSKNLYTVLLIGQKIPGIKQISKLAQVNAWGIGLEVIRNNPEVVEEARSNGYQVFVWTVDEKADLDLCLRYKVDVIISNDPGQIRSWIVGS